jgi:CRP-like cAMP-binding protein
MIVGLRYKDWIIGAPSVPLKKSYSFTVTTLKKSVLRCISAKNFLYLVKTHPEFVHHMLRILCQEYFTQGKKLGMLGCVPGRDRLKHLLYRFIRDVYEQPEMREKIKVHLPLKHKELAQIIAVSPEHLSRLLKELETQKVIRREKENIILLDHEKIRQWAVL